jgi:hypothetical protein
MSFSSLFSPAVSGAESGKLARPSLLSAADHFRPWIPGLLYLIGTAIGGRGGHQKTVGGSILKEKCWPIRPKNSAAEPEKVAKRYVHAKIFFVYKNTMRLSLLT